MVLLGASVAGFRGSVAAARSLILALEACDIEVLADQDLGIEAPLAPPTLRAPECILLSAPKAAPATHGPQRKGRSGKLRRW